LADDLAHKIVIFDRDWTFIETIGQKGPRPGEFASDYGNHRVQIFDGTGAHKGEFGALGDQPGMFNHPTSVALSAGGSLYVVDKGNRRGQVFSIFTGKAEISPKDPR
jgi:DNA-binding beta-propeller fold protein YncE